MLFRHERDGVAVGVAYKFGIVIFYGREEEVYDLPIFMTFF
jgi:hypothetical protein